jgi:hypothetical protein
MLIMFLTCNISGQNLLQVQYFSLTGNTTILTVPIYDYTYNTNFITYGTTADTFLSNLTSTNQCAKNIPLGFTYNYFNTPFTNVSVCQQAYIGLASSSSLSYRISATNTNGLSINSSFGTVSYRSFIDSATLSNLSSIIKWYYFQSTTVNFAATKGFVATWNNVPYASNQSLLVNAQTILVTDGVVSFFIMNFGRIDSYTFSSYGNLTSGVFTSFSGSSLTSNVGLPGTSIYLVNGQCKYYKLKIIKIFLKLTYSYY